MKANKKVVLSTVAVLGVAALLAGGTIAYFTDAENTENKFTVGKVDIALYESQLHRMNSGRTGIFSPLASDSDYCDYTDNQLNPNRGDMLTYEKARYCTPEKDAGEGSASNITAIENGHTGRTWGYQDETIIADANNYKAGADTATTDDDGYFTRVSQNIVPGQYIRKFSYVKNDNTGNNGADAYVLIRYMVPEEYADIVSFDIPSSAYLEDKSVQTTTHGNGYFTLVEKNNDGTYSAVSIANKDALKAYRGHVETINNKQYVVYSAVTTEALKPGEMTFWSPINTMKLNNAEEQTDSGNGLGDDVNYANTALAALTDAAISVKVDAQAIQAKTFANAIEAINNL